MANLSKEELYKNFENLSQSEKEKIISIMNENNQSKNKCNNYYLNEEIINSGYNKRVNDDYNNGKYVYKQLDRQELNKMLDYKDVWDFYYSCIATIENIALGKSGTKIYGYWDEFDSSKFKNQNQLVIQYLKILKNFKGAYNDYLQDYGEIINYPEDLDYNTFKKLKEWSNIINDNNIKKYIFELVNIINRRGDLDIQKELNKYYKNEKVDEKEVREKIEAFMKSSKNVRDEEKELQLIYEKNGELPKYDIKEKLNVPAGRAINNKNKYNHLNRNFKI